MTQRYVNADGYVFTGQDMQSGNMYAYCGNNPVIRSDSSGGMYVVEDQPQGDYARKAFEIYNSYQPSRDTIQDIGEDFSNFNLQNTSEQAVLDSNYFSAYNGIVYFKIQGNDWGLSLGVVFLGESCGTDVVRHEYGHTRQLSQLGIAKYLLYVGLPSLTCSLLEKKGLLPYTYYSSPWEYQADILGNVDRDNYEPWTDDAYRVYCDYMYLINMTP